jgi:hypothetical protein
VLLTVTLIPLLSGCKTVIFDIPPVEVAQCVTAHVKCPNPIPYTRQEQDALLEELAALGKSCMEQKKGCMAERAIVDYGTLRDDARACHSD